MHLQEKDIWKLLENVPDPGMPALSVVDLGIIRKVNVDGEKVHVEATPTYTGCSALGTMKQVIIMTLKAEGVKDLEVDFTLFPPWTSDRVTDLGREKMRDYGIAIKDRGCSDEGDDLFDNPKDIICPQCQSDNTKMVSFNGSTPCRAHYKCLNCAEPFDYFKCH